MTSQDRAWLEQFFGAYLHQDFIEDYQDRAQQEGRPEEDVAISVFLEGDRSLAELGSIATSLNELIASTDDEERLSDRLTRDFACYFYPPGAGLTTRQWLRHVVKQFEQEIARRRSSPKV